MKIATMARAYLTAPRPADMTNAPMDIAVMLAEGLAAQGHDITFFGPKGSSIQAPVETLDLPPLASNMTEYSEVLAGEAKNSHNILGLWDQYMAQAMFEKARAGEYDLLHFHHPESALILAKLYPNIPVVYTTHDPIESWFRRALKLYNTPNQFFVSISDSQRSAAPELPYLATIHNGIDTATFTYHETPSDYLLFSGRIMPEKGVHTAIKVAQATNQKLIIIGAVYDGQQHYFDTQVKPHLNDQIQYLGFLDRHAIVHHYQHARALLFPVEWEEPFGLTLIEAMSCGTPVIATRRGSIPEIIVHGRTGFIGDNLKDLISAVGQLDSIRRHDCRRHVERHFSIQRMVADYYQAFQRAHELADASQNRELALR